MTDLELGWLAAMIDAEGSFGSPERSFFIIFCSTDLDVVERVAAMFQRKIHLKKQNAWGRKQLFYTEVYGNAAVNLALMIYPILSCRRQEQLRQHLERYGGVDALMRRAQ